MKKVMEYTHQHNYMHVCEKCKKQCKNRKSLQLHLSRFHSYDKKQIKEYYDDYIKIENEDICISTGKLTEYINFSKGYNNLSYEVRKTARLPTQLNYWIYKHGKSKDEATIIVSELQGKRGKKTPKGDEAKKNSVRCVEYWMDKFNMTIDQAEMMVSQIQSKCASSEKNRHLKVVSLKNMKKNMAI